MLRHTFVLAFLPFLIEYPNDQIIVPDGYVVLTLLDGLNGPGAVRFAPDGKLVVGLVKSVIKVNDDATNVEVIATGKNFWAFDVSFGLDGTLYISDTVPWDDTGSVLWRVRPQTINPEIWISGFKYSQGVCTLPNGYLLLADPGWITYGDGRIMMARSDSSASLAGDLEIFVDTPTINPVKPRVGPDGCVYFLDRGLLASGSLAFISSNAGTLYRVPENSKEALPVIEKLNDPIDFAFYPDGSIMILDVDENYPDKSLIYKCDPNTGDKAKWATNFMYSHGLDVDKYGNIYVGDTTAGRVYKIKKKNCLFDTYSVFGFEKLKIAGDAQIKTPVNIGSNDLVKLSGSIDIHANLITGKSIITKGKSLNIHGVIQKSFEQVIFHDVGSTLSQAEIFNNNSKIGLTVKGNNPLDGKKFELKNKDEITLPSGDYFFHSLKVSNSKLFVSPGTRLFVSGDIEITGSSIVNYPYNPSDLVIISGDDVDIKGKSSVSALFYSKEGEFEISGSSELVGGIIAKQVVIKDNASVISPESIRLKCF